MYRINSVSSQMTKLQVVQGNSLRAVNLLPGNFIFSEQLTDQLKNLELNKVIRIREVKNSAPAEKVSQKKVVTKVEDIEEKETEKVSGKKNK